jgi:hypothetical protein
MSGAAAFETAALALSSLTTYVYSHGREPKVDGASAAGRRERPGKD